MLDVRLVYNHATSKRFEAVIDTGSDCCLFQAHIGESIGIRVRDGYEGPLGGVLAGIRAKVYYHPIKLLVAGAYVDIRAGFSDALDQCLLGQIGFFDHFSVRFNPLTHPPEFEILPIATN